MYLSRIFEADGYLLLSRRVITHRKRLSFGNSEGGNGSLGQHPPVDGAAADGRVHLWPSRFYLKSRRENKGS
jgi:hypothetical protein